MPTAPSHAPRRQPSALARAAWSLAACVVLAAGVAGCGSSSSPGSAVNPAGAVPASAPVYVGAIVRPEGGDKTAALSAGKTLSHQADPYSRLLVALQTPGSPALSFGSDVAPWLGPQAGIYLTSLASSGPVLSLLEQGLLGSSRASGTYPFGNGGAQGAIVMDTTDSSKAQSFLDSQAQHAQAHSASYRGVSYQISSGGVAFGLVDHLAVIGSESGLHGVIDTTLGGSSLLDSPSYSKLLSSAPAGTLAHVYSSPAAKAAAPKGIGSLVGVLAGGRTANISLVPATSSISVYADTLTGGATTGGGLLGFDPEGARALSDLPGESWLAVGLGNVGTSLSLDVSDLQTLASLVGSVGGSSEGQSSGLLSVNSLIEGLIKPLEVLGADTPEARRDFASWMGPAGVFGAGSSLLELKAGIIIDSKDPAASTAAVTKLADQLKAQGASIEPTVVPGTTASTGARISGLPLPLVIAAGRDSTGQAKFVMGLGEAAVTAALSPSSTLGSSASHQAAETALGESTQPNVILEFTTLISLLEGVGLTQDPTIAPLVPYLHSLTTLYGGGHQLSGEIDRYRLVLGLTQGG